jgi:hypothetical protein
MVSEHGYTGPLAAKWELLERRSLLAERALQACKTYGHGYRFRTKADGTLAGEALMTTAEQIAAELAALEAQP